MEMIAKPALSSGAWTVSRSYVELRIDAQRAKSERTFVASLKKYGIT